VRNIKKAYNKCFASVLILLLLLIQLPSYAQGPGKVANIVNNVAEEISSNETLIESKVFSGGVELNIGVDKNFTGEKKVVNQGTKLELTVNTVLGSDVSMTGDQFFAEVSEDLIVDGGVVIPMGTIVHGEVAEARGERRLGRNGFVKIDFDYLITPDGREIPIQAKMSTKSHPLKSFAKVVLTDAGYTLAGGAIGGLLAIKLGGIGMAVASHGYSVAGGAALGATVGAAKSLIRKGKPLMITPGDQIKMKIASDIELPVLKKSALADEENLLNGLDVAINNCKIEPDPFGTPNTITLGIDVINRTDYTFTFFDIAVVDEYGSVYYPSPFGDTTIWFHKIQPGSKIAGNLSFSVTNPRHKHWLVFYDKYSRKQLAKISIRNALRKLQASEQKSKKDKS
jgi:hypothetical protein